MRGGGVYFYRSAHSNPKGPDPAYPKFWDILHARTENENQLEVCALCGDADPRRVCRELHFV